VVRVFLGAFVGGLILAVLGAVLMPSPQPVRVRAIINVQPDGGGREEFVIRFPDDRIPVPADRRAEPAPADSSGARVLEDSAGQRVSGELFRLRDAAGTVIGVATRVAASGLASASPRGHWLLLIPGRGTLMLAQDDSLDLTARTRPGDGRRVASPAQEAAFWNGSQSFTASAGAGGELVHGTRDFARLAGRFTETWSVTERRSDGSAAGEIRLVTITRASAS
jgi:hypothetical protein